MPAAVVVFAFTAGSPLKALSAAQHASTDPPCVTAGGAAATVAVGAAVVLAIAEADALAAAAPDGSAATTPALLEGTGMAWGSASLPLHPSTPIAPTTHRT